MRRIEIGMLHVYNAGGYTTIVRNTLQEDISQQYSIVRETITKICLIQVLCCFAHIPGVPAIWPKNWPWVWPRLELGQEKQ